MQASGPESPSDLMLAFLAMRQDLIRFFAGRLRSASAAEDLIQDLYVRLAAADPNAKIDNASAYLYRLASNLMIDRLRSENASRARDDAWRGGSPTTVREQPAADEPSPEQTAWARQQLARMVDAVRLLPPRTQEIFRLHKLDGLSHQETALALGISRKAVEKQISAALKILVVRIGKIEPWDG